jgi:hypothetical protein
VLIVLVGPKPVAVTVTSVPVGPEVGDRVTVGVLSAKLVVATLPKLSVKVNDEPVVIPGRLTVPVYAPLVIASELSTRAFATTVPALTVIAVPAKVQAVIVFVRV